MSIVDVRALDYTRRMQASKIAQAKVVGVYDLTAGQVHGLEEVISTRLAGKNNSDSSWVRFEVDGLHLDASMDEAEPPVQIGNIETWEDELEGVRALVTARMLRGAVAQLSGTRYCLDLAPDRPVKLVIKMGTGGECWWGAAPKVKDVEFDAIGCFKRSR